MTLAPSFLGTKLHAQTSPNSNPPGAPGASPGAPTNALAPTSPAPAPTPNPQAPDTSPLHAQPRPRASLPGATVPGVQASPGPGAAPALDGLPQAPPVTDPMLAPAPIAAKQIASWRDATTLLHARSTDLASAYADVRRAEAQSRIALAAVLPTINGTANAPHHFVTRDVTTFLSGGASRTITTPQSDYVAGNVTLAQPLLNLQAWQAIGTARENEKVAKLDADETIRTITLGVASAMVAVVAAERVAELNRIGLRAALERRELTARKQNLGVGTGLDLVRADQDVAAARATLVTGDEALRKAREALGLSVGIPEQVGVLSTLRLDELVADAERTCPRLGQLAERPDVAAAKKRIDVADRNVDNVKLSFLPTLSAGSTFASTTQDVAAAPRTTWSVQAILSVPIWDGGVRYGQLRTNRALRDQATFELTRAERAGTVEVEQARRSVVVAEQSLAVAEEAREFAARIDRLTQIAYRAGQGTSLELVVAAAALRQAEISLALREFDVVSARLNTLFVLARCSPP